MWFPAWISLSSLSAPYDQSDGKKDNQEKSKDGADLVEFLAYSGARIGEVVGGGDANERRPMLWGDVHFERGTIFLPGTKTEAAPRTIPMSERLREFLVRLKAEKKPQPTDRIIPIQSARKCLQTACKKLALPQFTHHDFRHFFATTCIESGVDIPTVSRWLGHKDGGALAMKRYGHLRQEHSFAMIKRVSFDKPTNIVPHAKSQRRRKPENLRFLPTTAAPLPKPKRNTAIRGGCQKIRWKFFGDNSTKKSGLFPSKNFWKRPNKQWDARYSNRNLPTARRWRMNFRPERPKPHSAKSAPKYRRKTRHRQRQQRQQPIDYVDWLGGFPQKAVQIIFGINRMPQRPRRVQQTALGQSVNGDFGDAQINGRFRTLVSFFLNMCFRFRNV